MLIPHVGMPSLYPQKKFADHKIEVVQGTNHWHEFINAVRGTGPKPSANFEYSGPLSETILLGGIATRFKSETLVWDAPSLSFKGNPDATAMVKKKYRKGWEIKGLG
jgi:hypothetical protein